MKTIPEQYQNKIQSDLTVIWWGRRAFYEVVEELSTASWWTLLATLLFLSYIQNFPKMITWQFFAAVLIAYFYIWYRALIEIEVWRHEIFAVAMNFDTGEGRIYKFFAPVGNKVKFWQVFSRAYIDEPITSQSPAILPNQWWWYRLWGAMTGEQMMRVAMKSVNNTFLEGSKISPNFKRAIDQVRAAQPKKNLAQGNLALASLKDMAQLAAIGMVTPEEWNEYKRVILAREMYGAY